MLRKFICEVTHLYDDNNRVKREHIVYMPKSEYDNSGSRWRNHIIYMPESEYDTSGSRWKNHRWIEKKLGERYTDENPYCGRYYVTRIYQERL